MPDRYRRSFVVAILAGLLASAGGLPASAQTAYTLSGQVLDASSGESLPGANVQIVGTNFGTATNADGAFSFTVQLQPGEYRLRASFVGYETQTRTIEIGDEQDVTLDPIRLTVSAGRFEELVVTGQAGPTKRKELGNSLASVSGEDVEEAPANSLGEALQGKVAGAQIQSSTGSPGGGTFIQLRGASTVLGDSQPLIIIDGVIVNNDSPALIDLGGGLIGGGKQNRLLDIAPADIDRVEVVKGAAAAALYGSRANNGVIQIFTKEGSGDQAQVSYTSRFETSAIRNTVDVNMAQDDQGNFLDNTGNPLGENEQRWDWQDFIFRRAYGTEQRLSISGGNSERTYRIAGGYEANQGIQEGARLSRINARARLSQEVRDWVTVSADARFARTQSEDVPDGGVRAPYGALTSFVFGPNTFDPRPDETGTFPGDALQSNPVEVQSQFDFGQETNRFLGNIQATITPTSEFTIDYTLGLDTYDQVGTAYIPPGNTTPGRGDGFSRRAEQNQLQLNSDLNLRYETNVTPDLTSTTVFGGTLQYENTEQFSAESRNLSPIVRTVGSGSSSRAFGDSRLESSLYGVFVQQTVGVSDQLFVTGAARYDASSRFGSDNRWQFYPKGSVAYTISDHGFWESSGISEIVSNFKVRSSIGFSGGLTSIGPFDRFTSYNPSPYSGQAGLSPPAQQGAVGVRPERQREIEFGTDASFFENRLDLSFTYYTQRTEDLLLSRSLAPTSGFGSRLDNVGELENVGFELEVRGIPLRRDNFQWTSTVTYAENENEVRGQEEDINTVGPFGIVSSINDEPLGVYYGSAFKRNDAGEVVDQNGNPMEKGDDGYWRLKSGTPEETGDGIPAKAEEEKIIGDPNPDFTASWTNQFQIGSNLRFRVQLDATVGQDVFNFTRRIGDVPFFGTLEGAEREIEGDLPSGAGGVSNPFTGYGWTTLNIFEHWVEDGSYVKLREVAINYSLPLDRWQIEELRFNLSGRNLLSFDNYQGWDPEVNVTGQTTVTRNFDFAQVPTPRSFSLGVTATF